MEMLLEAVLILENSNVFSQNLETKIRVIKIFQLWSFLFLIAQKGFMGDLDVLLFEIYLAKIERLV